MMSAPACVAFDCYMCSWFVKSAATATFEGVTGGCLLVLNCA
eukprot:SAG31_NODE_19384_length_604_cov_0.685149_2_plen_41_part_01